MFDDDSVEAWKYGPVIPSIYHEFKRFGSKPISAKSIWLSDATGVEYGTPTLKDKNKKDLVLLTWQLYKNVSPEELIRLTHQPGTPWSFVYESGVNNVIPNHLMQDHYKEFIKKLTQSIMENQVEKR